MGGFISHPKVGIKEYDMGWKKLIENVAKAEKGLVSEVGLFEDSIYPDGIPVAYVGAINEFGVEEVGSRKSGRGIADRRRARTSRSGARRVYLPSRPWMSTAIDRNLKKYVKLYARAINATAEGKIPNFFNAQSIVANAAVLDLKESIKSWKLPGNAPSVIRKKGFDNPLINTKFMMNSTKQKTFYRRKTSE